MRIRKVPSSYSYDQLQQYLERVKWQGDAPQPTLADLRRLTRHHLSAVPFCNTFLIYEEEPPSVDPQEIFTRVVVDKGGCFCFGQNLLFREILRAIGYKCYSGAARVNGELDPIKTPKLGIQSHMTIFVTFEDSVDEQNDEHLYLVDVGFGRACIPQPMPLRSRESVNGFLRDWHRITMVRHPQSVLEHDSEPPLDGLTAPEGYTYALEWQARNPDGTPERPWAIQYMFTTTELYTADYESLHYYVCRNPPLFTRNIILSRLIPSPPSDLGAMGVITLFNNVFKRRLPNSPEERIELHTEEERMKVIKEDFGIGNLPENCYEIIKSKGLALSENASKGLSPRPNMSKGIGRACYRCISL